MPLLQKINEFGLGITDVFSRGDSPLGAFEDLRNFLPIRVRGLRSAFGYTQEISALPTGFPDHTPTATTFDMAEINYHPFPFSAEEPSSYDGRVYHMKDDNGDYHFVLKPWYNYNWKGTDTAVTSVFSGFIHIDDYKVVANDGEDWDLDGGGGASSTTLTIPNAASHGLSLEDDYYNGWRVDFHDETAGTTAYNVVADYAVSGNTATVTFLFNVGSGSMNWTVLDKDVAGVDPEDTLTFRRWFHRPAAMVATFDATNPGDCFASEGRVRGCGGASSDENHFPWVTQFINRTWMTGDTIATSYRGTYVDEMEMRPDGAGVDTVVTAAAFGTTAGATLFPAGDYQVAWTVEYDGFQESPLSAWQTADTANGSSHDNYYFTLTVNFPRMSKRVTAINLYMRSTISGVTSSAMFVKRHSLTDPTAGEISKWQASFPAGNWIATGGDADTFYVTGDEFAAATDTYYSRTGRREDVGERNIVAWRYTQRAGGRQFFGYFYDPNEAATLVDEIRYTGFRDSGAASFDAIPSDREEFEIAVAGYTGSSIMGLAVDNDWLHAFKDGSITAWYVAQYPEAWVPLVVSSLDGLASRHAVGEFPDGLFFADTDGFKAIVNQRVITLSNSIENTYRAFTSKSEIRAWYEPLDHTIRITDGVDETYRHVWVCYIERPFTLPDGRAAFPWYKLRLPADHYVEWFFDDEGTHFTNADDSWPGVMVWSRTAYTFGGGTNYIRPYLVTHKIVVDESKKMNIDKVVLVKSGEGDTGTLDNLITVDGTANSFASQDKAKTHLFQKFGPDDVRKGRYIQVGYNVNASGEAHTDGTVDFDEIQIHGTVEEPWNESA